jgi:EpsI family protein
MGQRIRVGVSLLCLMASALVLKTSTQGEAVPLRRTLDEFPTTIGGWRGQEATVLEVEVLNILRASDYLMRRYVDASGRAAWLYIGYWQTQRKGAQIHSPKNCLPGSGWEPLEASSLAISLPGGRLLPVNRFVIQKGGEREVVLYWYRAQGEDVAGEVSAKISMVTSAITRHRTDGALVRVSSSVNGTVAETSDRLESFVRAMYPVLALYLPD